MVGPTGIESGDLTKEISPTNISPGEKQPPLRAEGLLGIAGYSHVPEPGCGQQGCLCQNMTITLPSVTTVQNLTTKILEIRYYLGFHGIYPPGQVPANTEGEFCKIYEASQTWEQLPNLRQQLVITSVLKNWNSGWTCTGALEVDWCYFDPSTA